MLKETKATGKTVEEALRAGLSELGLTLDEVEYKVTEEPSKGFLGIFGVKPATVEIREKDSPVKRATRFVQGVAERLGVGEPSITAEEGDDIRISVNGENLGVLIGHRGEALDALQYLTSLVCNIGDSDYKKVTIDIENYRTKREEALTQLAERMANRVRRTGRRLVMEPMSPNERWVFHTVLQNNPYVTTHSEGEEPNRRVVIAPKRSAQRPAQEQRAPRAARSESTAADSSEAAVSEAAAASSAPAKPARRPALSTEYGQTRGTGYSRAFGERYRKPRSYGQTSKRRASSSINGGFGKREV